MSVEAETAARYSRGHDYPLPGQFSRTWHTLDDQRQTPDSLTGKDRISIGPAGPGNARRARLHACRRIAAQSVISSPRNARVAGHLGGHAGRGMADSAARRLDISGVGRFPAQPCRPRAAEPGVCVLEGAPDERPVSANSAAAHGCRRGARRSRVPASRDGSFASRTRRPGCRYFSRRAVRRCRSR